METCNTTATQHKQKSIIATLLLQKKLFSFENFIKSFNF